MSRPDHPVASGLSSLHSRFPWRQPRRTRPAAGGGEPWRPLETLEPRMLLDGSWDLLSDIVLARGIDYGRPGDQKEYAFSLSFDVQTGGGLASATLETPGGKRFDITDRQDAGAVEEWKFDFTSATSRGLSAFVAGLYSLELDFGAGLETTEFLFGTLGTSDPLPQPTQQPRFTSPTNMQALDGEDLTVSWRPVTDKRVNSILLSAEQFNGGPAGFEQEIGDTSTTTYGPVSLPPDVLYECSLVFAHSETDTNADGIDYTVATFTSSAVMVNTFTEVKPELLLEITGTTLPSVLVPGDRGTITVVVTNYGRAPAVGSVDLCVIAECSGGTSYLGNQQNQRLSLGVGKSRTFRVDVQMAPGMAPYEYTLGVHASTQWNGIDEIDPLNNDAWLDETREVVWQFGSFAGRKNVVMTLFSPGLITFGMSGPGYGTVARAGGLLQVDLASTSDQSTLRIGRRSTYENPYVGSINVPGSLGALVAPQVDLIGTLNVPGSLRSLSLHDTFDGNGTAIHIGQAEDPAWSTQMTFHQAAGLTIQSEMPIGGLTAQFLSGSVTCPRMGTLRTTAGDLNAALNIGGGGVGSVRVTGGDLLGSLVSTGPVGDITVTGVPRFHTETGQCDLVGGNILCSQIAAGPGSGKSLGNGTLTAGSFGTEASPVQVTAAGNVGNLLIKALRYKAGVQQVAVLDRWGEPKMDKDDQPVTRWVTNYGTQGGGIWVDLDTPGRVGNVTTVGGDLGGEIHAAQGMGRISLQALLLGRRTSWMGIACADGDVVVGSLRAQLTAEPGADVVAIRSISVLGGDITGSIVLDGKLGPVTVQCCAHRWSEDMEPSLMGGSLTSQGFQASAIGNIKLVGGAFYTSAQSATWIGNVTVVGGDMYGGLTARDGIGNVTLRALTIDSHHSRTWVPEGEGWWELEGRPGGLMGSSGDAALNIDLGGPQEDFNPRATLGIFTLAGTCLTVNGTTPLDPGKVRSRVTDSRFTMWQRVDEGTMQVHEQVVPVHAEFINNLTKV